MTTSLKAPWSSSKELISDLRSTVQRLDQSENPGLVAFLKELLVERIAELEKQNDESHSSNHR
jgi:hypothetical protein